MKMFVIVMNVRINILFHVKRDYHVDINVLEFMEKENVPLVLIKNVINLMVNLGKTKMNIA